VLTTLLLTEKALSAHDVQRLAHLHDPDPVRFHVVVPSHDDRSELAEAVDDVSRADFADALRDEDAGRSPAEQQSAAQREVGTSVAALRAAGVAEVDGEVVGGNPVDRIVQLARELDADEVVVLTEPHLLADLTRRDWATRLRHALDLPVLHVVLGTDQVVS
jgi:nucleotide-binding universal stress UspA family protein